MQKTTLKLITPSRLHVTLIDMNAGIGRIDGGIGITLDDPVIRINAKISDDLEVTGCSEHIERIRNSALKMLPEGSWIKIEIEKDYPSHVGLGSGTQAALAAGMAVNKIFDIGLSVHDIAVKVGRGGTSGIGVAAFESGGFILDGGHKFSEKKAFLPSAASKLPPAPILLRRDFPDWDIVIAIPEQKGASSSKEVNIFQKNCPIPLHEIEKLSHVILMKFLPALVEEDMVTFGCAVNSIQELGFKRREIDLQPISNELMHVLRDAGAYGSGMSSFGPTVYAFGDNAKNLEKTAVEFLGDNGRVFITKARNTGVLMK